MRVAITGASGFIGTEVCKVLAAYDHDVVAIGSGGGKRPDLNDLVLWRKNLSGAHAVIHLAARAHMIKDRAADPLAAFRHTNVAGTINIAQAAAQAGVRRFVFVSSIGVLGNNSGDERFSETTSPAPTEPYAVSKFEAEIALAELTAHAGLELVIVRPPLVYGPHVRGNFLRLLRLVRSGIPLPFGRMEHLRSFVGVKNLAELLTVCAIDQRAAGELFLVSDGEDISLRDLLRRMANMMHRPSRLFSLPTSLLHTALALIGRGDDLAKLSAELRVDSSKVRKVLGWMPTTDLDTQMQQMVRCYLEGCR